MQSLNNNALFHTNKDSIAHRKKKRFGRLVIRRSKINHSITNNSFSSAYPYENKFLINYRPQTIQLRHRKIRKKILNGRSDEEILSPTLSTEQKHIDFKELEQIFANAIRNRLPMELYKQKPQIKSIVLTPKENFHQESLMKTPNPIDTRIELSSEEPLEEIKCCLIHNIKQHKILSTLILIILSSFIGFFTVFIFHIK